MVFESHLRCCVQHNELLYTYFCNCSIFKFYVKGIWDLNECFAAELNRHFQLLWRSATFEKHLVYVDFLAVVI